MNFKNKVVVVTGASSGIGAAVAIAFSEEKAKVVMVGRNETKLTVVAARCTDPLVIIADVSKDADMQRIMDETIKKFGQLDILVNNAGLSFAGHLLEADNMMKTFDIVINTNLRGLVHMTSVAAPHLVKTKGNIVNISSVAASLAPALPGIISYSVSKAAVKHFGACAAAELAPYGIRVNTISPGPVKTDIFLNEKANLSLEYFKMRTGLKRYSEPEEIADLVLFVASDKAKGITGSDFTSDNGLTVKRF